MYLLLHGVKMVMMVNFLFCVFYNENIWFDNDAETQSFYFIFFKSWLITGVCPSGCYNKFCRVSSSSFTVLEEGKSEAMVPANKGSGEVLTPGSEVAPSI